MPRVAYHFTALNGEAITHLFEQIGKAAEANARRVAAAGNQASVGLRALSAGVHDVQGQFSGLAHHLGPVGAALSALGPAGVALGAGIGAAALVLHQAVHESAAFGQSLASLSAVMGATGKELDFLRDKALQLGSTTTESAHDVVAAFQVLARSSPALRENAHALAEVTEQALLLAEATGTAVPEAARLLAVSLNQFGAGADQAARFVNVLAAGARRGDGDLAALQGAVAKTGAVAAGTGVSIEELVATIETLTRAGVPAERAAQAINKILLKLQGGAADTNPALVGLSQALATLGERQLSVGELSARFGARVAAVARQLIESAPAVAAFTKEITDTHEAESLAATRTDTLEGSIKKLTNAWHAYTASIFESHGPLQKFIDLAARAAVTVPAALAAGSHSPLGAAETFTADPRPGLAAFAKRFNLPAIPKDELDRIRGVPAAAPELVGPPAPPKIPENVKQAAIESFGQLTRQIAAESQTAIDKINGKRGEQLKEIVAAEKVGVVTAAEAAETRVQVNANADKKIAEARATEAQKVKSAGADHKRLVEELANAERDAALAPLVGVKRVEAERDLAIERYAKRVAIEKDGAKLLADYTVQQEAEAQAKITKLHEEALDTIRKAQQEAALSPLTGLERVKREGEIETAEALRQFEKQVAGQQDAADRIAEYRIALQQKTAADLERASLEEAKKTLEPFIRAADDVQNVLSDALFAAFSSGKDAAFDFEAAVKTILVRLAAEVAQLFILKGILLPALASFGLGQVGAAPASGGTSAGGQIVGALLGGGGGAGGVLNFGASGGTQGGGLFGGAARLLGFGGTTAPATATPAVATAAPAASSAGGFNTFGVPTLLQKVFGDRVLSALGLGVNTAPGLAAAGPAFGGLAAIPGATSSIAGGINGSTLIFGSSGQVIGITGGGFGAGASIAPEASSQIASQFAVSGTTAAGTTTAAAAPATSAIGTVTAVAGLAIALGLAAKGLADTRASFDQASRGVGQGAQNRLTGLGAGTIAGFTAAGAGIGSIFPGLGTIIGAAIGAAVGSAVANAVGSAVVNGISQSVAKGLDQKGLDASVKSKLQHNVLLDLIGGGFNNPAFTAKNPAFGNFDLVAALTPNIEHIFQKVFRGALGGTGGLDTSSVPVGSTSSFGLKELSGEALRASRIIATAIGAGGQAFGEQRGATLSSILLGGVAARARKTGEEPAQVLADAFRGAFGGDFLATLRAAATETGKFRQKDTAFAAAQFQKGGADFGFDYARYATRLTQPSLDPGVEPTKAPALIPNQKAETASRKAASEAFGEALKNAGNSQAFQRALSASVEGAFVAGATKAFQRSNLASFFAPQFERVSKPLRGKFRRAKRSGNVKAEFQILGEDFDKKLGDFTQTLSDPAFGIAVKAVTDKLFKLAAQTAETTGDTAGVKDTIAGRLAPYTARVDAVDALARDVRSRSAIALAGPGFEAQQAQIAELTRTRKDAERVRAFDQPLYDAKKPGDQDQLIADLNAVADARLSELEAELDLQRQIVTTLEQSTKAFEGLRDNAQAVLGTFDSRAAVQRRIATAREDQPKALAGLSGTRADPVALARYQQSLGEAIGATSQRYGFFQQASEGFGTLSDQLDVSLRGRRAVRSQLREKQSEVATLVPTAAAGGAGAELAITKLQRLLPEVLQLGQAGLGGGAFRRLEREVQAQASALKVGTGGAADVAKDQLTQLETLAGEATGATHAALGDANTALAGLKGEVVAFRDAMDPAIAYLGDAARGSLSEQLGQIADLLGLGGPIGSVLKQIAAHFGVRVERTETSRPGPAPAPQPRDARIEAARAAASVGTELHAAAVDLTFRRQTPQAFVSRATRALDLFDFAEKQFGGFPQAVPIIARLRADLAAEPPNLADFVAQLPALRAALPHAETGALVTRPQLYVVGERSRREVVAPLEDRQAMAAVAGTVADAVVRRPRGSPAARETAPWQHALSGALVAALPPVARRGGDGASAVPAATLGAVAVALRRIAPTSSAYPEPRAGGPGRSLGAGADRDAGQTLPLATPGPPPPSLTAVIPLPATAIATAPGVRAGAVGRDTLVREVTSGHTATTDRSMLLRELSSATRTAEISRTAETSRRESSHRELIDRATTTVDRSVAVPGRPGASGPVIIAGVAQLTAVAQAPPAVGRHATPAGTPAAGPTAQAVSALLGAPVGVATLLREPGHLGHRAEPAAAVPDREQPPRRADLRQVAAGQALHVAASVARDRQAPPLLDDQHAERRGRIVAGQQRKQDALDDHLDQARRGLHPGEHRRDHGAEDTPAAHALRTIRDRETFREAVSHKTTTERSAILREILAAPAGARSRDTLREITSSRDTATTDRSATSREVTDRTRLAEFQTRTLLGPTPEKGLAYPMPMLAAGGFTVGEGPAYLHRREFVVPLDDPQARAALAQVQPDRRESSRAERPITVTIQAGAFALHFPEGTTRAHASALGRSFYDAFEQRVHTIANRRDVARQRVA